MSHFRLYLTCRLPFRAVGIFALLLCLFLLANPSAYAQESNTTVPLTGATQVAVGTDFACALIEDGTIWCWGGGFGGQLGDGRGVDSPLPVQVLGITDAAKVSAGNTHACALRTNGRVSCWGFRAAVPNSIVADGFATSPVDVAWAADAVDISTVDWQTCALLIHGRVRCWKYAPSDNLIVLETEGLYPGAVALGGYGDAGCVLMDNGVVNCWRARYEGYTNADGTALSRRILERQDRILAGADSIASDGSRSCAIAEGALWCWGTGWSPDYATEDLEDAVFYDQPIQLSGISNVAQVSLNNGLCAHTTDGSVACKYFMNSTGSNIPPTQEEISRLDPIPGIRDAIAIGKGRNSACAVVSSAGEGRVRCWGNNGMGQLGNGIPWSIDTPVLVAGTQGAQRLALSGNTTCALLNDGKVACWGSPPDPDWREGNATATYTATVQSLLAPASSIGGFGAPFANRICAAHADSTFSCAGEDLLLSFDDNGVGPAPARTITETTPMLRDVVQLAVGQEHQCALTEREEVFCFGRNQWGQTGIDTSQDLFFPQPVPGMTDVVDVAANDTATCAAKRDGSLWCWGTLYGAGGDFTAYQGYQPGRYPGQVLAGGVRRVSMNWFKTCVAMGEDGAQCWGLNEYGELGVPQEDWIPPTRVQGLEVVDDVAVGTDQSCFLTQGEVWCMGIVSQRTVRGDGNRNFNTSSVPLRVPLPGRALTIEAGNGYACAIVVIDDHTQVACWGWNDAGQVGANPGWGPVEVIRNS